MSVKKRPPRVLNGQYQAGRKKAKLNVKYVLALHFISGFQGTYYKELQPLFFISWCVTSTLSADIFSSGYILERQGMRAV